MAIEAELLALVARIYDAALEPELSPAVLRDAAALVGAPSGVIAFQDFTGSDSSFIDSTGRDPSVWKSYNEHYSLVSPCVEMMKSSGERTYATQVLLPDAELVRTEFYNDWLLPQDIHYHAGAVVLRTVGALGLVEFQVGRRHGPFPPQALRAIALLAPHFKRAIGIGKTLGAVRGERAAALEALGRLDTGTILLDEQGRPVYVNAAAEQWVRAGVGLRVAAAGLRAQDADEDARLQRLVTGALLAAQGKGTASGGWLLLRNGGDTPAVVVTVSPLGAARLSSGLPQGRICAAVFLSRQPVSPGLMGLLRGLFGLTAAETRVALALAEGAGVD